MAVQINNRSFFDSNEEMFAKDHTALLIIDMQNDFIHEDGYYAQKGIDLSMIRETIPKIQMALAAARKASVLVIYTQHTILSGFVSDSPLWLQIHHASGLRSLDQENFFTMDQTWGHEICTELKPEPSDLVMKKYRGSPFIGTSLETILKSHGVLSLAITGQVTNGCVENAVRMARDLDFYTAMVSDCVASTNKQFHDNTMNTLGARMPTPTAEELCRIWG